MAVLRTNTSSWTPPTSPDNVGIVPHPSRGIQRNSFQEAKVVDGPCGTQRALITAKVSVGRFREG